jgi:Uncharacterised protein family (UPF0158)
MEDFIASINNPGRADRLAIVIDGRGAFPHFKHMISHWPDDQERWYRFSDERRRGRARQRLRFAGYRVAPKGPETATQSECLACSSSAESILVVIPHRERTPPRGPRWRTERRVGSAL